MSAKVFSGTLQSVTLISGPLSHSAQKTECSEPQISIVYFR